LVTAMIDPQLVVYRCTRPGDVEYFSQAELDENQQKHPGAKPWQQGEQVTTLGQPFTGVQAVEYRLANRTADDFRQFKQYYGIEDDPTLLEPGWADFLVDALRSPGVGAFLLMIAFIALYLELHSPGVGIGGFVAAVCFVLFFWSNFLGGTAGWLAVTLFALGVCCLLLELFVLPGFAIFGLGGGALMLMSLVLASQKTFDIIPQNAYQFAELQRSLLTIAGAVVGFAAVASLLRKWLPHVPILNQVLLPPPSDEEAQTIRRRESLANFQDLLGTRGVTTTQLTPSGKARFGDRLIDVLTDGDLIARGTEVEVVVVYGTRVIVKAVEHT
jgi:membrane-bound serine protease (ClpP class)